MSHEAYRPELLTYAARLGAPAELVDKAYAKLAGYPKPIMEPQRFLYCVLFQVIMEHRRAA